MDIWPLQSLDCMGSGGAIVPKPEWGTKRLCQGCGAKFYDMTRKPIVCPKCEAVFEPETKTRKARAPRAEPVVVPVVKAVVAKDDDEIGVEVEVEVEDDDDDEAAAALLADDDDDDDDLDDVGIGKAASDDEDDL